MTQNASSELQDERDFDFMLLQYVRPGLSPVNIAVLLLDSIHDTLRLQFPRSWPGFDDEEQEVLSTLAEDLKTKAVELGANRLTRYLEETLSNSLLLTSRTQTRTAFPANELSRLFHAHVDVENSRV